MGEVRQFLASSPRGLADLLARELTELGATDVRERSAGVAFTGDLRVAYRACLESRVASRVFLELGRFEVADAEALYRAVRSLDWSVHLGPGATLACELSGRHPSITHTHFGALKLKDAIVDALREACGSRPDIALQRPSVRVHAHARGERVTVSLDLSGEGLHRRGYRQAGVEAPLKENLAAGMLLRAGWPQLAAQGGDCLDLLCGSGTIPIEAALIALGRAPGLTRDYYGFLGWRGHDRALWDELLRSAREAAARAPRFRGTIRGQDRDPAAIHAARANAARADVAELIELEVGELARAAPRVEAAGGLVCVNPPYGVRLEDERAALETHRELGTVLRDRFRGWSAAVLVGASELGKALGLRAHRTHALWNGALECRLLRLSVDAASERAPGRLGGAVDRSESPGAKMFANRLAKNLKRLASWARREGISCYRIYDADMPEYAFAIDLYRTVEPESAWLYVQEYAAPADIELESVRRRRQEALSVLPAATGVGPECTRIRVRRRTPRGEQYGKVSAQAESHRVREGGLTFRVNFDEYLDTGLFLDHRITRHRLREAARGKRFLNLFAYTASATVYAAAGGAAASTSVDLSRTYLDWARVNLALNGIGESRHELVQADCRQWLREAGQRRERYELVFLDPPTFSNSKRMQGVLDVERDHGELIEACRALLAPGGLIVFSTNSQRFKLDAAVSSRYPVEDISAATLPRDFERNPRVHRCYEIR